MYMILIKDKKNASGPLKRSNGKLVENYSYKFLQGKNRIQNDSMISLTLSRIKTDLPLPRPGKGGQIFLTFQDFHDTYKPCYKTYTEAYSVICS